METIQKDRTVRKQLLKTAEGYLELAMVFDDRWTLPNEIKANLVHHALAALEQAEQKKGDSAPILYLRGCAYKVAGEFEKAAHALTQVLEINDRFTGAYLALGWCYKRLDRLDLAIEALQFGVMRQPNHAVLHYNLACYFALSKQSENCIGHLKQALALDGTLVQSVSKEPDFDQVRTFPAFTAVMEVLI